MYVHIKTITTIAKNEDNALNVSYLHNLVHLLQVNRILVFKTTKKKKRWLNFCNHLFYKTIFRTLHD
jgi:hypothetical protein